MSLMVDNAGQIHSVVARGAARLRAVRALERVFALGIPAALVLAGIFFIDRFDSLDAAGLQWALAAAVSLPLAGLAWGLLQPVNRRKVATAIDRANGLHDRLGIAWGLTDGMARTPDGGFAAAAVRDAVRHLPQAVPASAFPLSPPRTWRALLLALIAAAVAIWVRVPEPPKLPGLMARAPAPLIDAEELAEERAEAKALKAQAIELEDERLSEIADQIAKLVDSVDKGELDLKRAFERIRSLETMLKEGADHEDLEVKAAKAAMKEMAKELKQARGKSKEAQQTKKLADALDKGDLEAARKQLERLAALLENPLVPTSLIKKLAKLFQKSAKKMQKKFDASMKKELSKELDRLKKLLRKQGLSEREKQRLKELQKQLANPAPPPKERQANTLDSPERNVEPEPPKKSPAGDKGSKKKADAEKDRKANKGKRGMSRAVNRLSRRMKDAAKKMLERGDPESQQEGAQEMAKGAQDIKSIHRAMRRQQARKDAQRRVTKLKESLRKGQKGSQRQQRATKQRRSLRRRARGGLSKEAQARRDGRGRKGRSGRKARELNRRNKQGGDKGIGNKPGDRGLGRSERLKSKRKDHFVKGKESGGPMDQEIILGAAQKGFAKTGYRDVFTRYRDVAEEELATDRVPAGYRRYVYRYFDLIRPVQGGSSPAPADNPGGTR